MENDRPKTDARYESEASRAMTTHDHPLPSALTPRSLVKNAPTPDSRMDRFEPASVSNTSKIRERIDDAGLDRRRETE